VRLTLGRSAVLEGTGGGPAPSFYWWCLLEPVHDGADTLVGLLQVGLGDPEVALDHLQGLVAKDAQEGMSVKPGLGESDRPTLGEHA